MERDSAKPQEYRATNPIKPAKRAAVFVIRAFIIEVVSIAVARFAGLMLNRPSYLGFRAVALHPRLYSVARIRGLGFDTRISCKGLGNDKVCILAHTSRAEKRTFQNQPWRAFFAFRNYAAAFSMLSTTLRHA